MVAQHLKENIKELTVRPLGNYNCVKLVRNICPNSPKKDNLKSALSFLVTGLLPRMKSLTLLNARKSSW